MAYIQGAERWAEKIYDYLDEVSHYDLLDELPTGVPAAGMKSFWIEKIEHDGMVKNVAELKEYQQTLEGEISQELLEDMSMLIAAMEEEMAIENLEEELKTYIADAGQSFAFSEDTTNSVEHCLKDNTFDGRLENFLLDSIEKGDSEKASALLRRVTDYKMGSNTNDDSRQATSTLEARLEATTGDAERYNNKSKAGHNSQAKRSVER